MAQNLILPSATCSWVYIFVEPWNNIVINQPDLKNKFIIFVAYNQCLLLVHQCHSSIISSDFRDYSWLRLGLDVGKWSRFNFWIEMLFQGQQYMAITLGGWTQLSSNSLSFR